MGENVVTASSSGGAGTRTMVLLGILAVLCGAVAYDYLYAQKRAEKVYEEIFAYCDDSMAKPEGSSNKPKLFSPADIHKMLGEKFNGGKDYLPTRITVVKPNYMVETYAIMGGAVFKTHDVHVVYTANDPDTASDGKSEAKFSTVELGKFPGADVLPQVKEPDRTTPLPPPPTAAGGGGGGGGGRRSGSQSASSGERKEEGKKEEESKKEEEKPADEKKPEGETKEETEKKEEAKPEAPPVETPPAETPPTETKPEPEQKPEAEQPKKEEPAADPPAKPEEKPAETPEEKPSEPK